jgi:hypothetical protein
MYVWYQETVNYQRPIIYLKYYYFLIKNMLTYLGCILYWIFMNSSLKFYMYIVPMPYRIFVFWLHLNLNRLIDFNQTIVMHWVASQQLHWIHVR